MNSSDGARLIYLSILLVAVVSPVLIGRRGSLGRTAQQFGIWVLIFLGSIAVYGLWPDLKRSLLPRAAVAEEGVVLYGDNTLDWERFLRRTWRELEDFYWDQAHA